jgi:hypothetical protein
VNEGGFWDAKSVLHLDLDGSYLEKYACKIPLSWPGAVVHTYYPSYLRGRDLEDRISRPIWGKKNYKYIFINY